MVKVVKSIYKPSIKLYGSLKSGEDPKEKTNGNMRSIIKIIYGVRKT